MKWFRGALVLAVALGGCSCSGGCSVQNQILKDEMGLAGNAGASGGTLISVANWNLQTFFDGTKDGCEYKEFQKAADWNNDTYKVRLERLCEFITTTDADIFVFEEMENEGIIYDISNQLAGNGHNWNQKKFWNYSVFAKEEETAIGIGILSRYPLSNIKTHSMDIRIHSTSQPVTRYILEAHASVEKHNLIILANHWKSKSGGETETEIWRDWQENILGKRIDELLITHSPAPAILICGDFNRDACDFVCNLKNQKGWQNGTENTILRYAHFGFTDYVSADSLWFTESGEYSCPKGSYYYDDEWERIDNIMLAGAARKISFAPSAVSPWASAQGYPVAYKIYSGQGWSDHLPLCAQILIYSD